MNTTQNTAKLEAISAILRSFELERQAAYVALTAAVELELPGCDWRGVADVYSSWQVDGHKWMPASICEAASELFAAEKRAGNRR